MVKPRVKHFDGTNGKDVIEWASERIGGRHRSPLWISPDGTLTLTNTQHQSLVVPRGAWVVSRREIEANEFTVTDWLGVQGLAAKIPDPVEEEEAA